MKAQLETAHGARGRVFQVHADDVNGYLKPFEATAKKFRTFTRPGWRASFSCRTKTPARRAAEARRADVRAQRDAAAPHRGGRSRRTTSTRWW